MADVQWSKCATHVGTEYRAGGVCPRCEPAGGVTWSDKRPVMHNGAVVWYAMDSVMATHDDVDRAFGKGAGGLAPAMKRAIDIGAKVTSYMAHKPVAKGDVVTMEAVSPWSDKVPTDYIDMSGMLMAALNERDMLRAEVRALRTAMVTKPNERDGLVCDNEWADA